MIRPIIDKRRRRMRRKKGLAGTPTPKPEWAEAFLILLLHKTHALQKQLFGKSDGAILTVPLESLEKFEKLTKNNKTLMSFDRKTNTVTIMAPEIKVSVIVVPKKKKIITKLN